MPTTPKMGYSKLTRNEKLICDKKIAEKHIKAEFFLKVPMLLFVPFKNPQPVDIAVV